MTAQFPLPSASTRLNTWTAQGTIRVLIAQAEIQQARSLRDQLIRQSYQVVGLVCSGLEALEFCWEHAVDAVLMEYDMPEMTGVQAARLIMQAAPTCIILLTAVPNQTAHRIGVMKLASRLQFDSQMHLIITTALTRFDHYKEVRDECTDTQTALRNWLVVDTAVQQLMEHDRISEELAFEQLREESLRLRCSLVTTAQFYSQRWSR